MIGHIRKNSYFSRIDTTMRQLLILLLFTTGLCVAQQKTIKGIIKDVTTLEPVAMATVTVDNTNISTVANAEGSFRIILPANAKSITVSHLSYKTYNFSPDKSNDNLEVFLEPGGIMLEEIVVTNKPVNEILEEIVGNSRKRLEKSLLLHTYYREFVKVNDVYTKFADGLLDYYVKRKSGVSDLQVKQSRSSRLVDAGTTKREQMTDALYLFDVREAIADAYSFKGIRNVLSSPNYTFELRVRTDKNGKSVEIIKIIPKPEVEKILMEGFVVYDPATKLILEMDINYSEAHKKYIAEINALVMKFTLLDESKKTGFKVEGTKYIMTYNKHRANFHAKMGNKLDDTFDFVSDIVAMDYKDGEFELDKKLKYKEKSLFAAGTHFTEEFWKTNNTLLPTEAEEKVIQSLK